jgi:hypothetical protein
MRNPGNTVPAAAQVEGPPATRLQVLSEIDGALASLYQSAPHVLADSPNPRRLLLPTHAVREMTAGLSKFLNLSILDDQGRAANQVSALEEFRPWLQVLLGHTRFTPEKGQYGSYCISKQVIFP